MTAYVHRRYARGSLLTRRALLERIGHTTHVGRRAWAFVHDDGERVVFNGWAHRWDWLQHPMRTDEHYRAGDARGQDWQRHLDSVLAGEGVPVMIVAVPADPTAAYNKGAVGWLPLLVTGEIVENPRGLWFAPHEFVQVPG